jgi:hypothetical protein
VILSQLTSYARPGMAEAYKATLEGMMDIELLRPHRILDRLEEIAVPTQLLWGARTSEAGSRMRRRRLRGSGTANWSSSKNAATCRTRTSGAIQPAGWRFPAPPLGYLKTLTRRA